MTLAARPGLHKLFKRFSRQVKFVSVYVREPHPGDRYPHHSSEDQKMRHARDWASSDRVPWTVAVDSLDGATHRAYGGVPNPLYLIDRTGRVAFRMLWAAQPGLLESKIEELLRREAAGEDPVKLGERENMMIPMLHGMAAFDVVLSRAGQKARQDVRRELGMMMYGMMKMMSMMRPMINRGHG